MRYPGYLANMRYFNMRYPVGGWGDLERTIDVPPRKLMMPYNFSTAKAITDFRPPIVIISLRSVVIVESAHEYKNLALQKTSIALHCAHVTSVLGSVLGREPPTLFPSGNRVIFLSSYYELESHILRNV